MEETKKVEQELAERREANKTKTKANKSKKDKRNAVRQQLESREKGRRIKEGVGKWCVVEVEVKEYSC
jgi:hypothetical protein